MLLSYLNFILILFLLENRKMWEKCEEELEIFEFFVVISRVFY